MALQLHNYAYESPDGLPSCTLGQAFVETFVETHQAEKIKDEPSFDANALDTAVQERSIVES